MSRWALVAAFALVVGACTSDAASPGATPPSPTTTGAPDRTGLTGSPALLAAARQAGDLDSTSADRYSTFAMFSAVDLVPIEYLVPVADRTGFEPWDHGAITELLDRWEALGGGDRVELAGAVEGLAELVGPSPDSASAGCSAVGVTAVRVCAGDEIVRGVSDASVDAAAAAVRPWARGAARAAWASLGDLFGSTPELVEVRLVDIASSGAYAYRRVAATDDLPGTEVCHLYVDVLAPEIADPDLVQIGVDGVPDGVPLRERVEATVAHQMFHCFARSAFPTADGRLVEGAATWAEQHVYPERQTPTEWTAPWVLDPNRPFTERSYDLVVPFLYADLRGPGPDAILTVLAAGSIDHLAPDFADLWSEISVATWAMNPAVPFIDADPGDGLEPVGLASESEGSFEFDIPMFSRRIDAVDFAGVGGDVVGFARLALDLSDVPDDVRITAIPETAAGPLDPVPLGGTEWVFCRAAVGACNDAAASAPYTRIVLIATNVDNGDERFQIRWNTYNPSLEGTWVRVRGPISTVETSPYWIVGTELAFDEPGLAMSEDAADSTFTNTEPGWACALSGGYSIAADPLYGRADRGSVSGTVTVTGDSAGDGFTTECAVEEGATLPPISVPIFDAPGDTFGFEIRDYDTLWIYGDERIYLYERAG